MKILLVLTCMFSASSSFALECEVDCQGNSTSYAKIMAQLEADPHCVLSPAERAMIDPDLAPPGRVLGVQSFKVALTDNSKESIQAKAMVSCGTEGLRLGLEAVVSLKSMYCDELHEVTRKERGGNRFYNPNSPAVNDWAFTL